MMIMRVLWFEKSGIGVFYDYEILMTKLLLFFLGND